MPPESHEAGLAVDIGIPPRWATAATLLLAVGGPPALALASTGAFDPSPGPWTEAALQTLLCAVAGVVLLVVTRIEGHPLASIGLRPPTWASAASALLVALGVLYVLPYVTIPLTAALGRGHGDAGLARIAHWPLPLRMYVALTSGAVEETLYRGYAVERLAAWTGRRWLAGALATLAFGAAHLPFWGVGNAVGVDLPFGAVMTAFYLWRRDLVANAAAHTVLLWTGLVSVIWP